MQRSQIFSDRVCSPLDTRTVHWQFHRNVCGQLSKATYDIGYIFFGNVFVVWEL
jgi:hypothetical protein